MIQILTNLVSNAHKYTSEGGGIQLKAEHIHEVDESAGTFEVVHVSVMDSGFGISEEDQRQIFQQFFRSEDSDVRQENGTGLGLSITKNLVEMQDGRIWFQSVENEGTTFHFTIPTAELDGEIMGSLGIAVVRPHMVDRTQRGDSLPSREKYAETSAGG